MKKSLAIQKGIRQSEDDIVIAIQKALNDCEYPTSGRDKLEESQFRNLVSVADTTDSAEVVKNFLRYQVGRERKWGRGKNSLAEQIIQDIDNRLKTTSNNIFNAVKDLNDDGTSLDQKGIWMELIRRYLGYGSRHLRYLNTMREG
ncbi:hypothetical protein IQ260_12740 [Leptolyngbya cf. ectocarpi LEGE 11479]|uniref:Uncharacterized protein n=1 Tax=Leptolyngbya cf. ectocarpi LEGE 11479 TaxID=1828722 RepID=A0A928ZU66_LEPEC|nr:hypothetical protein [Leptolyngbya ectocarpi]MBE9067526.1 hypothetical protein [Leptolyngbya cf. ectocarpi LEGE 11479]